MKSFFAVYKLLETPLQNNSNVIPILLAKMAVRAAGLDEDHVAYYTLTWSWLRDDANYTKHAFSKKKEREFFPTIYLKLHYEVLTLNVLQD